MFLAVKDVFNDVFLAMKNVLNFMLLLFLVVKDVFNVVLAVNLPPAVKRLSYKCCCWNNTDG